VSISAQSPTALQSKSIDLSRSAISFIILKPILGSGVDIRRMVEDLSKNREFSLRPPNQKIKGGFRISAARAGTASLSRTRRSCAHVVTVENRASETLMLLQPVTIALPETWSTADPKAAKWFSTILKTPHSPLL
jgi:hypothetical protein